MVWETDEATMSIKSVEKEYMADPAKRARIEAAKAEIELRVALYDLRKGRVTQAELADALGVSQRRVSAIEHSGDLQISTLRSYLESLGFELEIVAKNAEGERTVLQIG